MKKRIVALTLIVTMIASLFIGCDNSIDNGEKFANVRFSSTEIQSKGLNSVTQEFDASKLYWKYEAKKTDNSGLKTGETVSGPIPVGADGKLSNTVGPFSLGEWQFKLYAYNSSEDAYPVYTGTKSNVVISADGSNQVNIKVSALQNHSGYVEIADNIVLRDSFGNALQNYNEVITFSRTEDPDTPVALEHTGRLYTVPSGSWKISISYQSTTTPVLEYGKNVIYVTVFDNQTIRIEGSLEEITTDVIFSVTVDGGQNVVFTPPEPIKHDVDNSYTVPTTSETANPEKEVKVDIPAGSLKQGGNVELNVTNYDAVASNQNFVFEDKVGVIGSININLKVADQPVTEFDKPVTITTFVGKNLPEPVKVKYNGGGEDMQPTTKGYDPSTGMITFETSHFSQFYIVAEGAAVLNTATGKYYVNLVDALKESAATAEKSDPIIIFGDAVVGNVDEEIVLENKNITLNLGGKAMIFNQNAHIKLINSRMIINNGTVKGDSTFFVLKDSELIFDGGKYIQDGDGSAYMFKVDPSGTKGSKIMAIDGTFDGAKSKGIFHTGREDKSDNYLKILDGSFTGMLGLWEGNGTVEIKGGNFVNDDTVYYQKQGKLYLLDGRFTSGAGTGAWTHQENGAVLNGSAVVLEGTEELSAVVSDDVVFNVAQPADGRYKNYEVLVIDWSSADGAPCAHPVDRTGMIRPYQYARVEGPAEGTILFNDANTRTFDGGELKSVFIDFNDFGSTFRTGGTYISVMFDGHKVLTTKDRFSENGDVAVSRIVDSIVANNKDAVGANAHQHGYSVEKISDTMLRISNPNGINADNWSLVGLGGQGSSESPEYPIYMTLSNNTVLSLTIDDRIIPQTHEDLYYAEYYKVFFNGELIDPHRRYSKNAVVTENLYSRSKTAEIVVEAYNMNGDLLGKSVVKAPVDEESRVNATVVLEECTDPTAAFGFSLMRVNLPNNEYFLDGIRYTVPSNDYDWRFPGKYIQHKDLTPGMHKLEFNDTESGKRFTYDFELKSNVPLKQSIGIDRVCHEGDRYDYYLQILPNQMELDVKCLNGEGLIYPGSDLIFDVKVTGNNDYNGWSNVSAYLDDRWVDFRKDPEGLYRLHLPTWNISGNKDVVIYAVNHNTGAYAYSVVPVKIEDIGEVRFPSYSFTVSPQSSEYYSTLNVGTNYTFTAEETYDEGCLPCTIQWFVDDKPAGAPNEKSINVKFDEVGRHEITYRLNTVNYPSVYMENSYGSYDVRYIADVVDPVIVPGSYFKPVFSYRSSDLSGLQTTGRMNMNIRWDDSGNKSVRLNTNGDTFFIPETVPVGKEVDCMISFNYYSNNNVSVNSFKVTTREAVKTEKPEFSVNVDRKRYENNLVIEFHNRESFPGYEFTYFVDDDPRELNVSHDYHGIDEEKNFYYLRGDLLEPGEHRLTIKGTRTVDGKTETVEGTKTFMIEKMVQQIRINVIDMLDGVPTVYTVDTYYNTSLDGYTITWYRNTPNGYEECGKGRTFIIPSGMTSEYLDMKVVMTKNGTGKVVAEAYSSSDELFSYVGSGEHYFSFDNIDNRTPYETSIEIMINGQLLSSLPPEELAKYEFSWFYTDLNSEYNRAIRIPDSNTPKLDLVFKNLDENYNVNRDYRCEVRYRIGTDNYGYPEYRYIWSRGGNARFTLSLNPSEFVDFVNADRVYYTYDNTEALKDDHASAYIGTLVLDDRNKLFTYDYAMIGTHLVEVPAEGGNPAPAMLDTPPSNTVKLAEPFVAPVAAPAEQDSGPQKAPQMMYDIMNLKGSFKKLANGNIELTYKDMEGISRTEIVRIAGNDAIVFDRKLSLLTGVPSTDMKHLGTWRLPSVKLTEATLDEVVSEWLDPMVAMYLPVEGLKAIGFEGCGSIDANVDLRFEKDVLRLAGGVDLKANLINSSVKLGEPFNIGGEA